MRAFSSGEKNLASIGEAGRAKKKYTPQTIVIAPLMTGPHGGVSCSAGNPLRRKAYGRSTSS